jgi:hypothetical protein
MTTAHTSAEIIERDGVLLGPLREPRNLAANIAGSIHDDSQAQRLGFRGGTVAGSIHMEQFPPVLLRAFEDRWFETGSLSCDLRNATMDREPVRAFAEVPPASFDRLRMSGDAQVNVWMDREDGMRVLEGTASVGSPSEPSMLRRKVAEPREAGEMRILAHLSPGQECDPVTVRLAGDREEKPRLDAITEPLDWYTGASPWGGAIVNPGLLVHLMVRVERKLGMPLDAVGLYGAIEIRHLAGPVFVDRGYEVTGRIVTTGQTPKTEYVWYETVMRDGAKDVATMLMMLRFMKASSPLWAEG